MLGFIGLSGRNGCLRRATAQVAGRLWLSAIIIVFATAGIACRRSEPSGSGGNSQPAREVTVSAAVSLKDDFGEIGKQYESRTGERSISISAHPGPYKSRSNRALRLTYLPAPDARRWTRSRHKV